MALGFLMTALVVQGRRLTVEAALSVPRKSETEAAIRKKEKKEREREREREREKKKAGAETTPSVDETRKVGRLSKDLPAKPNCCDVAQDHTNRSRIRQTKTLEGGLKVKIQKQSERKNPLKAIQTAVMLRKTTRTEAEVARFRGVKSKKRRRVTNEKASESDITRRIKGQGRCAPPTRPLFLNCKLPARMLPPSHIKEKATRKRFRWVKSTNSLKAKARRIGR